MDKDIQIGIMSGRLSPKTGNRIQAFPKTNWKNEFVLASDYGFKAIEWIFDEYENPILSNNEIQEMKFLSNKFNIQINSICCDYFMNNLLFQESKIKQEKTVKTLEKIIKQCHQLSIEILEIPLVDSSSLKSNLDEEQFLKNLEVVLPIAQDNNVYLTLETDFPPEKFRELLLKIDHPNIKANYDTGNSASCGYNTKKELEMIGGWIKNIHIKDRVFHGTTVPLGSGDVDFNLFFSTLRQIGYKGNLIIQGARIEGEEPQMTCRKYMQFIKQYIDKYF